MAGMMLAKQRPRLSAVWVKSNLNWKICATSLSRYNNGFIPLFILSLLLQLTNPELIKLDNQPLLGEISSCFSPGFCDEHKISPCNINADSTPEVMRIKDTITLGEFS